MTFKKNSNLYNHRSYYQGKCNEKIQEKQERKKRKVEAKEVLSSMDPVQVIYWNFTRHN